MARLSRRFSRYFSLTRRSRSTHERKLNKSNISNPLVSEDEATHALLPCSHAPTHPHSSIYTISDTELRSMEQAQLSTRPAPSRLTADIDALIAQYEHTHMYPAASLRDTHSAPTTASTHAVSASRDPSSTHSPASSTHSPTPSSTYSPPPSTYASPSPSPSPRIVRAKLDWFEATPPAAPGWEKVSFGRETVLFGPECFSRRASRDEGRAGRRKDWRGEFGRRGYGVL